jgi:hypothetical protein
LRGKVLRGLSGDFFKRPHESRHLIKPEGHFKSDVFEGSRGELFTKSSPDTNHQQHF